MFVGSILLLFLGYGGYVFMPDKTSAVFVPLIILCLLLMAVGALGMVGAIVYAVVKAVAKQPTQKNQDPSPAAGPEPQVREGSSAKPGTSP